MEKAMTQGMEKTSPQLSLRHAQLFAVLFVTSRHQCVCQMKGLSPIQVP